MTTTYRSIPTRLLAAFAALLVATSLLSTPAAQADLGRLVSVIVRELPGSGSAPEAAVERLGGTVGRHIGIIDSFTATVPSGAVPRLRSVTGVGEVSPDRPVKLQHAVDGYDPGSDAHSMHSIVGATKARDLWSKGFTGGGVDVALIDSGVVPVNGLTAPGKVIHGPDLSFEAANPNAQYLDTYGHGTHLAGIIAGKDDGTPSDYFGVANNNHEYFTGIAPDSRIVNVKVANAHGATDVSQVLAAIDWVVQHRNDNGMNIRVLNLSFGTDGTQNYLYDPLTYAAEVAWRKGIVVVVAAGNSQFGTSALNNPAYDPYVIAVGANDTKGTYDSSDDTIPDWSARGDGVRNPDLVAPGRSIQSLRSPGSNIDQQHGSTGKINERFFRGSGTSQSAAVVSGAAALLLSQRPGLTPDQVKALLKRSATPLPAADVQAQGSGALDLKTAAKTATPTDATQTFPKATGTGSLEGARGSLHVESPEIEVCEEVPADSTDTTTSEPTTTEPAPAESEPTTSEPAPAEETASTDDGSTEPTTTESSTDTTTTEPTTTESSTDTTTSEPAPAESEPTTSEPAPAEETASADDGSTEPATTTECHMERVELTGEQDAHGSAWDGATWSSNALNGATWSGGDWNGATWSGATWSGATWSGATWSGATWSGATWSGATWSGATWSGATWSGATWSGATWSGATWSGATWSGATWSGATWSGATWSGATWSGATWSGATWSGATWSGATWSGAEWA